MVKVLIATNEPILAKGLETSLGTGGLQVTAICSDIVEVFESVGRCRPDVAVIDLPVLPAPEVIRELRQLAPRCQFVLWPRQSPPEQVRDAVRAGARGVLAATASPAQLIEAVNLVASFATPEANPATVVNSSCTPSERELITLVGYGLNDQEIAAAMRSDEATVNTILKSLSHRLGAGDRYELALYGLSTLKQTNF